MNKEIKFMLISAVEGKVIILATFPDFSLSMNIEKFDNVWKPVFFNSDNSPEIYRINPEEKKEHEKAEAWLAASKKLLFTEREIQELLENKELSFPVLEDSCN